MQGDPPPAAELMALLGLSEDELCRVLGVDPLTLIAGELDHRPELGILLDLLADAQEQAGPAVLRRWVRSAGPRGQPIELLLARDFAGFEQALELLAQRGWVLRSGRAMGNDQRGK